ncbi:MAG: hypothetical protein AAF580_00225 [Pseudomonadota bacterium]
MRHETLLDGVPLMTERRSGILGPTLLRYDAAPDFLEHFYADLRDPDWRTRLLDRADLPERGGVPLVPQTRHRKIVLVVVDAACLVPGMPRLDPEKVVDASMAIRREVDGEAEGWFTDRIGTPLGWASLPADATPANSTYDPSGTTRRGRLLHHNPALAALALLTGDSDGLTEAVDTLHPIPDDIAKAIGRTLFFGALRTTSSAVIPGAPPPPPLSVADVGRRLPALMRADPGSQPLPANNSTISRNAFKNAASAVVDGVETNAVAGLRAALAFLANEAGAFTDEPYADALKGELSGVTLNGGDSDTLFDFVAAVQSRLVEGGGGSVRTPDAWPQISANKEARITQAAHDAIAARWQRVSPSITRFGTIGERYHVRCLLRVNDEPACPPRIVWSPKSTAYTIRPWYESDGGPVTQVELPDITADGLRALAPDVAVKVPPSIQDYMDKLSLGDLLEGNAKKGPGLGFGMICGFNIPIITICAFIILQIFLQLLNIIFFWLPFVRICIPFPTVTPPSEDGDGGTP